MSNSMFLDSRLPDRFWDKTQPEPNSGCWIWTGATNRHDYGVLRWPGSRLVHRIAYDALVGPLTSTLVLDHRCRNTLCCNPAHLEQVTQRVNSQRNYRATRSHCAVGHAFDDKNTYRNGSARKCRRCHADKEAARKRLNTHPTPLPPEQADTNTNKDSQ